MKSFAEFWKSNSLLSPIVIVLVLLALYFILPFRLVSVVSGSMEPTIPTGSLCIVNIRRPYEKVEEGDVIVYVRKYDGLRIIHRVIEVTDEGLVTKGDHNQISDGLSTGSLSSTEMSSLSGSSEAPPSAVITPWRRESPLPNGTSTRLPTCASPISAEGTA